MKQGEQCVKRHIISMRISAEEWDSLQEAMEFLQFHRVSDLMREAFKLVLTPASALKTATAHGEKHAVWHE